MAKHSFYLSVILHLRTHLELTIFILHNKQNDTIWGLLGVTLSHCHTVTLSHHLLELQGSCLRVVGMQM